MEYTAQFMTLSDCTSADRNATKWAQFEDIALVTLDEASVISQLTVASEGFCIAACHADSSCVAVQVNTTSDDMVMCQLLSNTPSLGKVRNQTGVKLLFKGRRSVYNIDTDVSTQCDGLTGCSTLIVNGNVYLTLTSQHYNSKLDARNACLNMPAINGQFDLAIVDNWPKITAVQSFLSTLPIGSNVWAYTGGEAGYGVNDPANKWNRTGTAIDPTLWYTGEPNEALEECVMITENYHGLIDTGCDGHPTGGQDANTLCEYFPN